jgi:putative copper export protein
MGMWIEFGLFCLVLVFALHQFYDLKKEKQKREAAKEQGLGLNNKTSDE